VYFGVLNSDRPNLCSKQSENLQLIIRSQNLNKVADSKNKLKFVTLFKICSQILNKVVKSKNKLKCVTLF
jgi:hypothetical protein